jgi:chemotaxis response regulator CheB
VVRLDRSLVPRAGDAYLLPSSKSLRWSGDLLEVEDTDATSPIDSLFAAVTERYGKDGTLVLLAGDRPDGLEGLSRAAEIGALTFVQDEQTALFSSWSPEVPSPVRRFDWGDIAQTLLQPMDCTPVEME